MKKLFTYLLSSFILSGIYGQDLKEDLTAFNATYHSIELSIDYSVVNYDWDGIKHSETGRIRKKKSNYFSSLGEESFLIKGKVFLRINDRLKTLSIQEMPEVISPSAPINEQLVEQWCSLADSVLFLGKTGTEKRYRIHFSSGLLSRVEIVLGAQFIKELVYYYPEATEEDEFEYRKTIISYKKVDTSGVSSSYFDLNDYVRKLGSRYVLVNKYEHYELRQN